MKCGGFVEDHEKHVRILTDQLIQLRYLYEDLVKSRLITEKSESLLEGPLGQDEVPPTFQQLLRDGLQRFGLDVTIEAIYASASEGVCSSESGLFTDLIALLTRDDKIDEARRVAGLLTRDDPRCGRFRGLLTICRYSAGNLRDIEYAKSEMRDHLDSLDRIRVFLEIGALSPEAVEFAALARKNFALLMGRTREVTQYPHEILDVVLQLAICSGFEDDFAVAASLLNSPHLQDSEKWHMQFEYVLGRMENSELAMELAKNIQHPIWRKRYLGLIAQKRPDLN
jgi:hypothetical protein